MGVGVALHAKRTGENRYVKNVHKKENYFYIDLDLDLEIYKKRKKYFINRSTYIKILLRRSTCRPRNSYR